MLEGQGLDLAVDDVVRGVELLDGRLLGVAERLERSMRAFQCRVLVSEELLDEGDVVAPAGHIVLDTAQFGRSIVVLGLCCTPPSLEAFGLGLLGGQIGSELLIAVGGHVLCETLIDEVLHGRSVNIVTGAGEIAERLELLFGKT